MNEFHYSYGKYTTPEADYQYGHMDGYVAGKEACADEIAQLREALEGIMRWNNQLALALPEEALPALAAARAALAKKEEK